MEKFCTPYPFGPLTGAFVTQCFTDLVHFLLATFIIFVFGVIRLVQIRRLKPEVRPYTKQHLFELGTSILLVLCPTANFIYLIVVERNEMPIFKYLMTIAWAFVWLWSLIICELEYQRGVKHNWCLITFWVLAGTFSGIRLQAMANEQTWDLLDKASLGFCIFELVGSVLLSFNMLAGNELPPSNNSEDEEIILGDEKQSLIGDKKGKYGGVSTYEEYDNSKPKMVQETESNIFSRVSFWWLTPLLKKGYRTSLVHDDLPQIRSDDDPTKLSTEFSEKWQEQEFHPPASLTKALFATFWKRLLLAALFKIGNDIFIFTGPVVLELVVDFVQNPNQELYIGVLYALAMFLGSTIQSLSMQQYWQQVYRLSMVTQSALITKVYSKSLWLSNRERQRSTIGEITNLQSTDAKRLSGVVIMLHQIWSAPLQIIISVALLWRVLGVASIGGVAVLILTSPIQILTGKLLANMTKEMMSRKDKRIKATSEVLQSIRVIKFFAWEESFLEQIKEVRWNELSVLRKSAFVRASISLIWILTPLFVTLVTFGIFVAIPGNVLTPSIAFSSLALFNVMRFPLNILPMVITQLIEAQVSLERLERFFSCEELDRQAVEDDPFSDHPISIEKGTFEWEEGKSVLSNISIAIPKGALVAVVGEVGAGKSSLLNALLGEMQKTSGRVVVNGSIAYVPQTAWIKNATVKDNIVFMKDSGIADESRYKRVIKVCQLEPDLSILSAGDKTEIGEKGINLSGGQKQRVSLARAVYSDADIYLLDDPLSAVDAHVGKSLFVDCIKGALSNKTRILVTHQLHFVNQCDLIIVMNNGRINEMGSFNELMSSGSEFSRLISKHVVENQDKESKKEEKDEKKKTPTAAASTGSSDAKKPDSSGGKLISTEQKNEGGVNFKIYAQYMKAIGGIFISTLIIFLFVAENAASMTSNYWLSYWSVVADDQVVNGTDTTLMTMAMNAYNTGRQTLELGFGTSKVFDELGLGVFFYLMVYGVIGAIDAVIILVRSFLIAQAGITASKSIHNKMFKRILHAPVSYFDTVPVGRILNRFSSDQNVIDVELPRTMSSALDTVLTSFAVLFVIASATPIFLIALLPLSFLYRYVQKYYLHSSRELMRLDSVSRSPIYALFSETLVGQSTIRAYNKTQDFVTHNEDKIRYNQQATYMSFSANRWLGVWLELCGSGIVFAATFFAVISKDSIDPGMAGLSISYALRLTSNLNWLVRMSTDVENNLIAVERCQQTLETPNERAYIGDFTPAQNWPNQGGIEFRNLSMRYRENLPMVLKDVQFTVKPREKIGVVGRTGSGKSSLMLALFRIVEAANGTVIIDGQDIQNLGLKDLRSRLSIIPQDPTLFSGTIRSNLDPFGSYSDQQLWDAIVSVGLDRQVQEMTKGLDSAVSEGGENLSVGSRQLLCLARAILRRSKILVMDEATANVDFNTDATIQKTIRKEFADVTMLTIAHRINTIMDSDRVLVLDQGRVLEYDKPSVLLSNKNSVFYSLAKEAGLVKQQNFIDQEEEL
eukprot:TRINITY_DN7733_c0_g1_i1.p1 TRINITY_DN7733_c0_g1~~TRINITY_DN7733_c0_g1_i1.p1  ORF type:complete len:1515 (-),score=405.79 TRINITY_DN7733_c0_g1_i1:221-4765(-)